MTSVLKCIFSPTLYKLYKEGPPENIYQPNTLEKWSNTGLFWMNTLWKIGLYTSPITVGIVLYRGSFFLTPREMTSYIISMASFVVLCTFIRSCGRSMNSRYIEFVDAINVPDEKIKLTNMRKYDFDFHYWPVTYAVDPVAKPSSWLPTNIFNTTVNSHLPLLPRASFQIMAYVAVHTFGLRLIYPGTLTLLQTMLWNDLMYGRMVLVQNYDGQRAKIQTADMNTLDTMFVDNRNKGTRGKYLVVCCEGNAGFYEIGIMTTPIKGGYSALGWNHPGFAGSTGTPYPEQEQNAVDSVMQYALNELGFEPQNIILFGWSIGGYSATWAATRYPEIKALILDATFDDLLPLARQHMPPFLEPVVREVVRGHVDLHVARLLLRYPGPVHLVRRVNDEIICLRPGQLATNCGNQLLTKLIEHRHRAELEAEHATSLYKLVGLSEEARARLTNGSDVATAAKQMAALITSYMTDVDSTHCTQLSDIQFEEVMSKINTRNGTSGKPS